MMRKNLKRMFVHVFCAMALLAGVGHSLVHAKKPKLVGVININTASIEQLKLLPRVGPKMARRIVAYRSKHKFTKPSDITKVRGIGQKTFFKMKPNITTSQATNVRPVSAPPAKR